MNLDEFKNNPKTSFLAGMYEKLARDEAELNATVAKDPSYKELAEGELASLAQQKTDLQKQMEDILAGSVEEEEKPKEVVMEIRAGAGGRRDLWRSSFYASSVCELIPS